MTGTGKTLTTIGITGALYGEGKIRRVLVVAPLSIVGVWKDEFERFAAFSHSTRVLEGSLKKRVNVLTELVCDGLQVVIVNYESAWRMEELLLGYDAQLVIADEGHRIKNHDTRQSKVLHRLGAKARYRLLLTGTVVANKGVDVFSQYRFVDPGVFGESFYAFRNRYFEMIGFGNHTAVLKKSKAQELTDKLYSVAFRTTKAECLDLPETMDILRHVELEPSARKAYEELVNDSFAQVKRGEISAPNMLTQLLRLSQLTGGFVGTDVGTVVNISNAKLAALSDIIDEAVSEDKKLVIIARFIAELKAIEAMLGKKKIGYSLIMGGVKDREMQVQQFQQDPEVKVFVGQIATAGMGITLTAASTMVFYSVDYSMSNFEQTKARIHRVGQRYTCSYVFLVARNTIDEKVLMALRDKADLAKLLMDECRHGANPFLCCDV